MRDKGQCCSSALVRLKQLLFWPSQSRDDGTSPKSAGSWLSAGHFNVQRKWQHTVTLPDLATPVWGAKRGCDVWRKAETAVAGHLSLGQNGGRKT